MLDIYGWHYNLIGEDWIKEKCHLRIRQETVLSFYHQPDEDRYWLSIERMRDEFYISVDEYELINRFFRHEITIAELTQMRKV